MKKIQEIIKPFLSIIFGALLLLFYLNRISYGGGASAIVIVVSAITISLYYLSIGIIGVVMGDKINKKTKNILDLVSIVAFPIFMFINFLVSTIDSVGFMGPTGWIIAILSMIGSLAFSIIYLVAKLSNIITLNKFTSLFSGIFILVLLLNILFDRAGNPILLGAINIIGFVINLVYIIMLLNSFAKTSELPEDFEDEE